MSKGKGWRNEKERHKLSRLGIKTKKYTPKKLDTEEIIEAWENDRDFEYIQISDDGGVRYVAHGDWMETIVEPNNELSTEEVFKEIRKWQDKHGIYFNIWSVNERGNVELMDNRGNELGGLA
jgi:hypothetical protein